MSKRAERKGAEAAPSQRQLRVAEEIRHALAAVLARGDVREVVVIAINARSQGDVPRLTSDLSPGVLSMALSAINTPIDGRSAGLLRSWAEKPVSWTTAGRPLAR